MKMKSHECIVISTIRKSPSGNLEMQSSESMRPLAYFQEKKSNGATSMVQLELLMRSLNKQLPILIDSFARPTFTKESTKQ